MRSAKASLEKRRLEEGGILCRSYGDQCSTNCPEISGAVQNQTAAAFDGRNTECKSFNLFISLTLISLPLRPILF
jgi:hypothetical protein